MLHFNREGLCLCAGCRLWLVAFTCVQLDCPVCVCQRCMIVLHPHACEFFVIVIRVQRHRARRDGKEFLVCVCVGGGRGERASRSRKGHTSVSEKVAVTSINGRTDVGSSCSVVSLAFVRVPSPLVSFPKQERKREPDTLSAANKAGHLFDWLRCCFH